MTAGTILVIDDNKNVLKALELFLQMHFKQVKCISTPNQLSTIPQLQQTDLILLDMNFSAGINTGNEGLFWLRKIKEMLPHVAIILMTAYGDVELAVKALKQGGNDFILKPWDNHKLLATIQSALALQKTKKEVLALKSKQQELKQVINRHPNLIVGNSKALNHVLQLTHKVAKTNVNVLITGENGTGKELIARELHEKSSRKNEVFIAVDMGAISESLLESELFGHVKGAFTDAKETRTGKFEAAHQGTLFLDEIGNLSLAAQAKLLSVIQNREIVKVGSNTSVAIDIRLICATNCDLEQLVAEGKFREDLLYRIKTIHLEVPPLRERADDVLLLADFYLQKFAIKYDKKTVQLHASTKAKLQQYQWPGNVRELRHAMERAIILSDQPLLKPEDFVLNQVTTPQYVMQNTLEDMEKLMIEDAIHKHDGNYSAAAEQLGISRQTLYNKLKKMNL
ncbi:sigma-54-dependent transcriptional regulator [Zhouia sp. PK063]|uniref:sigma-54-dependent transcriptional regulator n=1 Tax=Zhouia sp. PK063 TaxID=3373602 RepID=UPI00378F81BF